LFDKRLALGADAGNTIKSNWFVNTQSPTETPALELSASGSATAPPYALHPA
jgi:hypothetical protein